MDPRNELLAKNLVNFSVKAKKGDKVYIQIIGDECKDLMKAIIREVYKVGAYPFTHITDLSVRREELLGVSKEMLEVKAKMELEEMKQMDCFIAIRGGENSAELSDVPDEKRSLYDNMMNVVLRERVDNTRWVVLRYPSGSMAQLANMSTEKFEDFYYQVCTLDYKKMDDAMTPLVDLMNKTDKVHLVGPGTDLTFSIKGMNAIKCAGDCNIPDGEIYTAPVRESMNGKISYNTQSLENGFTFENIVFEVKNGKIVNATSNNTEKINSILDTDEGARYFGEFAIGVNPYVLTPMKDTLFDEKICGSFHLTPGCCYEDCSNGNHSAIHWDLVNIQRPEYGGGQIWFDDVLIREDGLFVLPQLECLNPNNLK